MLKDKLYMSDPGKSWPKNESRKIIAILNF